MSRWWDGTEWARGILLGLPFGVIIFLVVVL